MAVDADAAGQELEEPNSEFLADEGFDEPTEKGDPERDDIGVDTDTGTRRRAGRRVLSTSVALVIAVSGLLAWLAYHGYQSHRIDARHHLFMVTARQAALNLTTINYAEAEADVQRILDTATGSFREDFKKRSQPFIDVVKQSQSKSQGSVTETALESEQGDSARVLVAVTVNTLVAGVADERPRDWRMRISVQKVGDDAKVSNVEFVP